MFIILFLRWHILLKICFYQYGCLWHLVLLSIIGSPTSLTNLPTCLIYKKSLFISLIVISFLLFRTQKGKNFWPSNTLFKLLLKNNIYNTIGSIKKMFLLYGNILNAIKICLCIRSYDLRNFLPFYQKHFFLHRWNNKRRHELCAYKISQIIGFKMYQLDARWLRN